MLRDKSPSANTGQNTPLQSRNNPINTASPALVFWGGRNRRILAGLSAIALFAVAGRLMVRPLEKALKPEAAPLSVPSINGRMDDYISRQISLRTRDGWTSVIVKLDSKRKSEEKAVQASLRALGAQTYQQLPLLNSVAMRVPNRNLEALASQPFVNHLSWDGSVKKCDEFTQESSMALQAYDKYNVNGSGVTIAVIDSGIDNNREFANSLLLGSRIKAAVSFVDGDKSTDDKCGHGTHVAGIAAGNGIYSRGIAFYRHFYGIAQRADLVNVRVLDAQGAGNVSSVIAGIQWVVNNKARYNIRVMNISLGHPVGESYTTDPLCQAVEAAWKAGIVVVCAAGNNGRWSDVQSTAANNEGWGTAYGSIQCPGNDPYVITVGATKSIDGNRTHDQIATYSSRGPSRLDLVLKPDIVAPGNQIVSVDAENSLLSSLFGTTNSLKLSDYTILPLGLSLGSYFRLSGTSMASPVVAGAAALMLDANPNLSPDTIKARMMITADKWAFANGKQDPCTFGAGYLNVYAAMGSKVVATQYAMSPTLSQDDLGNVFINLDPAIWGTKAIWGTGVNDMKAIWGTSAVSDSNALSSSKAIWGTSVWADKAIWGTSSSQVDLSKTALRGD